ncbi:MAG: hypothetical protein KY442_04395, partial [Proteobacteria bacterium]|nr:hypothetical protein [Pseudomonadota bacterium]
NPDRIGLTKPVDVAICGDARQVARAILGALSATAGDAGCEERNGLIHQTKSAWLQQLSSMDHEDDDPGTSWNAQARERDAELIFTRIASAGPAFIHITEYDATRPAFDAGETLAELATRHARIPVIANGQLGAPERAESLIANGHAEVITLGKSALANPDWPRRVMAGEPIEEFDFSVLQPQANIKEHEL